MGFNVFSITIATTILLTIATETRSFNFSSLLLTKNLGQTSIGNTKNSDQIIQTIENLNDNKVLIRRPEVEVDKGGNGRVNIVMRFGSSTEGSVTEGSVTFDDEYEDMPETTTTINSIDNNDPPNKQQRAMTSINSIDNNEQRSMTSNSSSTTTISTNQNLPKDNDLYESFPDFEDLSYTNLATAESNQPARVNVRPASSGKDYEYEYIYYYYYDDDGDNGTINQGESINQGQQPINQGQQPINQQPITKSYPQVPRSDPNTNPLLTYKPEVTTPIYNKQPEVTTPINKQLPVTSVNQSPPVLKFQFITPTIREPEVINSNRLKQGTVGESVLGPEVGDKKVEQRELEERQRKPFLREGFEGQREFEGQRKGFDKEPEVETEVNQPIEQQRQRKPSNRQPEVESEEVEPIEQQREVEVQQQRQRKPFIKEPEVEQPIEQQIEAEVQQQRQRKPINKKPEVKTQEVQPIEQQREVQPQRTRNQYFRKPEVEQQITEVQTPRQRKPFNKKPEVEASVEEDRKVVDKEPEVEVQRQRKVIDKEPEVGTQDQQRTFKKPEVESQDQQRTFKVDQPRHRSPTYRRPIKNQPIEQTPINHPQPTDQFIHLQPVLPTEQINTIPAIINKHRGNRRKLSTTTTPIPEVPTPEVFKPSPEISPIVIIPAPILDNSLSESKSRDNYARQKSINDLYALSRLHQLAINTRVPNLGGFINSEEAVGTTTVGTVEDLVSSGDVKKVSSTTEAVVEATTASSRPNRFRGRNRQTTEANFVEATTEKRGLVGRFSGRRRFSSSSTTSGPEVSEEAVKEAEPTSAPRKIGVRNRFAGRTRPTTSTSSTTTEGSVDEAQPSPSQPTRRRPPGSLTRRRLTTPTPDNNKEPKLVTQRRNPLRPRTTTTSTTALPIETSQEYTTMGPNITSSEEQISQKVSVSSTESVQEEVAPVQRGSAGVLGRLRSRSRVNNEKNVEKVVEPRLRGVLNRKEVIDIKDLPKGVIVQVSSIVTESESQESVQLIESTTQGSIINRLKSQRKPGSLFSRKNKEN